VVPVTVHRGAEALRADMSAPTQPRPGRLCVAREQPVQERSERSPQVPRSCRKIAGRLSCWTSRSWQKMKLLKAITPLCTKQCPQEGPSISPMTEAL
jgi:hypothetical protein